jgi:CBS domain-containing protein
MRALDVGCLPVARAGAIVGIITRGDLVRSGLPPARLP